MRQQRKGFALAVAMMAIVIIGTLVAGAFFASTQEFRVGRNTVTQEQALAAAEFGLYARQRDWNPERNLLMATGVSVDTTYTLSPGTTANVRVTRLGTNTFWFVSQGTAGPAGMRTSATRRLNLVVRVDPPVFNFRAALTSRGATRIGGSSEIDGNDSIPNGWNDCPPSDTALPGLSLEPDAPLSQSGSAVTIRGDPPIARDPLAGDTSTYFRYGGATWNTLKQSATLKLPVGWSGKPAAVVSGGVCIGGNGNWGDPSRSTPAQPCERRYPIIYAAGNLQLTGGYGQGILLVEGDLTVAGGFRFYGPVIVRGSLKTTGTGGHFNGGVMAANVDLDQNVVLGNALVSYSSCAILKAQLASAPLIAVERRAWASMY